VNLAAREIPEDADFKPELAASLTKVSFTSGLLALLMFFRASSTLPDNRGGGAFSVAGQCFIRVGPEGDFCGNLLPASLLANVVVEGRAMEEEEMAVDRGLSFVE